MKERIFVLVISSFVLGAVNSARAQQTTKTIPRIGFISSTALLERLTHVRRIPQRLRELGYVEGKNLLIEHRYAEGRLDRLPMFVHEFVQQKVNVIVGANNVVIRAAKEATKTIPIVMVTSIDPVAAGYVESFARPGGNITGLTHLSRDISAKRVELLTELLPRMSRVGILRDADGPGAAVAFKEYEARGAGF